MGIDVVVPVFNGSRFVRRAVQSVLAQQRCGELTVWCVDDGSTDGSDAVLETLSREDPRVRSLRNPLQVGVAATRNIGIRAGRDEFVAFIDQDDVWVADKLSRQLQVLRAHPGAGYAVGLQEFRLEDGMPLPAWCRPEWLERPQPGYIPSALLVRRDVLLRVGLLDENFSVGGDDTDWFARARRLGLFGVMLDETVFIRGVHDGNLLADPRTSDEILDLVRRHISSNPRPA